MVRKCLSKGCKVQFLDSLFNFKMNKTCSFKKDGNMFVEHITVQEFKQKLDDIYRTTESPTQFYSIHNSIKEIIMNDLIREDEEKMRSKDVWKNLSDQYPDEGHAYAAKLVPNVFGSDELILAQAQKKELSHELQQWLEALN